MGTRAYDTKQYRDARRRILASKPLCHWCQTEPADQIDHLVELDAGGDNSSGNLVPACAACNAGRGNRYRRAKERAARSNNEVTTDEGPFFAINESHGRQARGWVSS